jgi:hypothetical protein
MAADSKSKKDEKKPKSGDNKAKAAEAKPKKPKAAPAAAPEAAEAKPVVKAPERAPADPRMKYAKKFKGRLLPKGPLRDRHKELLARWNAPEHGGVTVEELKSLLADWRAARAKAPKPATA